MKAVVLVVDDEAIVRDSIEQWLELSGYDTHVAKDADEAIVSIRRHPPDVVLTDLKMPRKSGIDLMREILKIDPDIPVVLLTAHGDIPLAVAAIREGAYDFLQKPYVQDHLATVIARAIEKRRLKRDLSRLSEKVAAGGGIDARIIGISPAVVKLRNTVIELAAHDPDVIITGETGTGKEVIARALHDFGPRSKGPFVAVNCAAIPAELFESELFGHEAGAFTSAKTARTGKFEFAQGGTLLLDEIESMPLSFQAKILRALQERSIERVGSNKLIPLNVRIITASKSDLAAESRTGKFRSDLYFRLAGAEILLPPLRVRGNDIPLLFEHFSANAAKAAGADIRPLQPGDIDALLAHSWPGNVRELKNAAERYALGLSSTGRTVDEILQRKAAGSDASKLSERVAAYERLLLETALRDHNGSIAAVTEDLGIPRRTLNEKMVKYGLFRPRSDKNSPNSD